MSQPILTRTNGALSSSHKLIYTILALPIVCIFTENFLVSWSTYIFHFILSPFCSGNKKLLDDHHALGCENILNKSYIWRNVKFVIGNSAREVNWCAGNNDGVQAPKFLDVDRVIKAKDHALGTLADLISPQIVGLAESFGFNARYTINSIFLAYIILFGFCIHQVLNRNNFYRLARYLDGNFWSPSPDTINKVIQIISPVREVFPERPKSNVAKKEVVDVLTKRFRTFLLHLLPSQILCDYLTVTCLLAYWVYTVDHSMQTIFLTVYMVLASLHTIIYTAYIERGKPTEEQMNIRRRKHGPIVLLGSEKIQLLLGLLAILVMGTDDKHVVCQSMSPIKASIADMWNLVKTQIFEICWSVTAFWLSCSRIEKVFNFVALPYFVYVPMFKGLYGLLMGEYTSMVVRIFSRSIKENFNIVVLTVEKWLIELGDNFKANLSVVLTVIKSISITGAGIIGATIWWIWENRASFLDWVLEHIKSALWTIATWITRKMWTLLPNFPTLDSQNSISGLKAAIWWGINMFFLTIGLLMLPFVMFHLVKLGIKSLDNALIWIFIALVSYAWDEIQYVSLKIDSAIRPTIRALFDLVARIILFVWDAAKSFFDIVVRDMNRLKTYTGMGARKIVKTIPKSRTETTPKIAAQFPKSPPNTPQKNVRKAGSSTAQFFPKMSGALLYSSPSRDGNFDSPTVIRATTQYPSPPSSIKSTHSFNSNSGSNPAKFSTNNFSLYTTTELSIVEESSPTTTTNLESQDAPADPNFPHVEFEDIVKSLRKRSTGTNEPPNDSKHSNTNTPSTSKVPPPSQNSSAQFATGRDV